MANAGMGEHCSKAHCIAACRRHLVQAGTAGQGTGWAVVWQAGQGRAGQAGRELGARCRAGQGIECWSGWWWMGRCACWPGISAGLTIGWAPPSGAVPAARAATSRCTPAVVHGPPPPPPPASSNHPSHDRACRPSLGRCDGSRRLQKHPAGWPRGALQAWQRVAAQGDRAWRLCHAPASICPIIGLRSAWTLKSPLPYLLPFAMLRQARPLHQLCALATLCFVPPRPSSLLSAPSAAQLSLHCQHSSLSANITCKCQVLVCSPSFPLPCLSILL